MTLFGEFRFFAILAALLVPVFVCLLIPGGKDGSPSGAFRLLGRCRRGWLFAVTLIFDALAIGTDPVHWLYFVLYLVWELALFYGYLKLRTRYGRKGRIYAVMLVLSILPLVLSKVSGFLPVHLFQILGISYLTFKSAQIIIEIYDGVITELNLMDTACFLLFFPGILSGPIDRSRRFGADLHKEIPRQEYLEMAGEGLFRILLGLVYKVVLAAVCFKGVEALTEMTGPAAWIGYAYCYGLYMFFDFAGYSLMAVGAGLFFGVRTPDNFDKPFISKDIKEFWDRWHISLSHWFRDFLFTRFVMQSMRHKWFKNRLQTACAGFVVDMFVMGVWHGLTPYYLLYGLYHGVLLALNEVWQKKSGFYKKHKKKKWYQVVSWAVTMQLVMFGFLLFSGHLWT